MIVNLPIAVFKNLRQEQHLGENLLAAPSIDGCCICNNILSPSTHILWLFTRRHPKPRHEHNLYAVISLVLDVLLDCLTHRRGEECPVATEIGTAAIGLLARA